MTTDLEVLDAPRALTTPTTIGDVAERLAKAKEFMETALVEAQLSGPKSQRKDGDYGKIPGCGDKPVLFKSGAEKLARLFDLEVRSMTRTLFERIDADHGFGTAPGFMVAYNCEIAGPDGRVWGAAEAFTSHEEDTFQEFTRDPNDWKKKVAFRGFAPLNTLAARAQKRAYVRALVQALGITSLVSTHDGSTDSGMRSEDQRAIIVAIYEHVSPRMVDQVTRQATRVKSAQWAAYLGAALDLAADAKGWDDTERARVFARLDDEFATTETVAAVFGEASETIDVDAVEEES